MESKLGLIGCLQCIIGAPSAKSMKRASKAVYTVLKYICEVTYGLLFLAETSNQNSVPYTNSHGIHYSH